MFRLTLLPLIVSLTGCATVDDRQRIDYLCDNDYRLHVELDDEQARIFMHDRTLVLPRRPDMKGERYVSDDRQQLFLRKGNHAVLAISAGHGMLRCTRIGTSPSRSPENLGH
ncbi:MliC family protein [Thiolapillus brandeum]|uniref:MliC family protein n=1 Tax=Thiolapillus brandeum TaxID=1076588 RepID=UPI000597D039|nr:MliC family protein [Thiolapillus brandeum]